MSILVTERTSVIIQGITGQVGRSIAEKMIKDGTRLVGGVVPGKGGQSVAGVPVYESVSEAADGYDAVASFVVAPARFVLHAALEALQAGVKLVVVYAEGVPTRDSLFLRRYSGCCGAHVLGPNSAGAVSPGKCNVSDLDLGLLGMHPGTIGVVSKSGTLTYEVALLLSDSGLGCSTVVCLGSDEIVGTSHVDMLREFEQDEETTAVVLLGEPGGRSELVAAEYVRSMETPVVAYISGHNAPLNKPMGHSGAIVRIEAESAQGKTDLLYRNGAACATSLDGIPGLLEKIVRKMGPVAQQQGADRRAGESRPTATQLNAWQDMTLDA